MKKAILLFIAGLLFLNCENSKVAGNTSEEGNAMAMVRMPDGTPAPNARITILPVTNLPGSATKSERVDGAAYETVTDEDGEYAVPTLPQGLYNVIAAKDTLAVKQDSVPISEDDNNVQDATLARTGGFTAMVAIQPNHDPRTVVAQLVGTNFFSNVDENALFRFVGLAAGQYTLRLSSTLPSYTPTFFTVNVQSGIHDSIIQPFELIYTGIPAVTGLKGEYDTLKCVVKISWNASSYRNLMDYLVFKDDYSQILPSTSPIAAITDTMFYDTIYSPQRNWDDSLNYRYKYRVCVRNNEMVLGTTFRFVDVQAIAPKYAFALFPTDTQKVLFGKPCTLKVTPAPFYKGMRTLECDLGGTGAFRPWSKPETTIVLDSLAEITLVARFTDTLGLTGIDTLQVRHCILFQKAGAFSLDSGEQASAKFSVSDQNQVWLLVRSNGIRLLRSYDGLQWNSVSSSLPFSTYSAPVWFRDSLYVVDDPGTLWVSGNGIEWNNRQLGLASASVNDNLLCVSDSQMFLVHYGTNGYQNSSMGIYKSPDAVNWTSYSNVPTDQDYYPLMLFSYGHTVYCYLSFVYAAQCYSLFKIRDAEISSIGAGYNGSVPFYYLGRPPICNYAKAIVVFDPALGIKFSYDGLQYSSNIDYDNQTIGANLRVVFALRDQLFWVREDGVYRF